MRLGSRQIVCVFLLVLAPPKALGQDLGAAQLRCETFCSQTTLRTATARLTWIDPALQPGAPEAAGRSAAAMPTATPQVDVTVVKNGFNTNAYATFPTTETDARPAARFTESTRPVPTTPRAYDLRVVGSVRPAITGRSALEESIPSTERRETSLLIENLEPGLRYTWRLRFNTGAGEQFTAPIACVAPVCPADLKE